jgi:hypothetical protein
MDMSCEGLEIPACTNLVVPFVPEVQVFVECFCSLVFFWLVTAVVSGKDGLWKCVAWDRLKTTSLIAVFYALGDIIELMAIAKTNSSYYMVIGQVKLMITAMLSKLILGRGQSSAQWILLFAITVATVEYCLLLITRDEGQQKDGIDASGLILCLVKVGLASVNAVLTERAFKKAPGEPIWVNQAQLKLCSLPVTALFVLLQSIIFCESMRPGECLFYDVGIFHGWNVRVACLLSYQVFNAVIIGLVYKHVNAVVKYLAYAQSLWITYLMDIVLRDNAQAFNLEVFGVIVLLVLLVIAYSLAKLAPISSEEDNHLEVLRSPSLKSSTILNFMKNERSFELHESGIQMTD